MAKARLTAETEEERRARMAREMRAYEEANADTIVPGTSKHDGHNAHGGIHWNDAARMAKARQLAHGDGALNDQDRKALELYPEHAGWVGEDL